MGVYENRIQDKMSPRHLNWNVDFLAALANAEGIPGASEASLSKSFRNLKELDSTRTAMPLDLLLGRFIKMTEAVRPFELQFSDPTKALQLLKDFESGALTVSITHQEPGALIYRVHVIENLIERNRLFQGIRNNEPIWGKLGEPGVPIKDVQIAETAVGILRDLNHPCHVTSTSIRTTETKIAKSLVDLGFILQEKEDNDGLARS